MALQSHSTRTLKAQNEKGPHSTKSRGLLGSYHQPHGREGGCLGGDNSPMPQAEVRSQKIKFFCNFF